MDLKFEDLSYFVNCGIFRRDKKQIIKSISGEFKACELTAVMGPSGSGKTTLLNILSGFNTDEFSGPITVNREPRDLREFTKHSAYIMQEENLFPLLSVRESMSFAVKFKTGIKLTKIEQEAKVESTLRMLKLENTDTFIQSLSGGQRKRISIAIELLNDPQIIFLDECTTGLDSFAASQCLGLLKEIARTGRTVICTIHQPSARQFEMFDQLYVIAEGSCIFNGPVNCLVPFLKECEIPCPSSYNPADYVIEVASNDYGPHNNRLRKQIENGKINFEKNWIEMKNNNLNNNDSNNNLNNNNYICHQHWNPNSIDDSKYSSSFLRQLKLLLLRNFLFMYRDKTYMQLRLGMSIFLSLLIGGLYFQIGYDASNMISSFQFVMCSVYIQTYTAYFSMMVRFPLDYAIVKREHFNRHYSSMAYYLAFNLADSPLLIVCSLSSNILAYAMAGMPLEFYRVSLVAVIGVLTSFSAQIFGIFCGSMSNVVITVVIAIPIMIWHVTFCGGFVFQKDASPLLQWNYEIDFLKHAADGVATAVFGWDREKLPCSKMYCHFQRPADLLKNLQISQNVYKIFISVSIILGALHLVTYFNMKYRLKK
ncbi:hypothetical protein ACKWTF_013895 [Chironomus riparius]